MINRKIKAIVLLSGGLDSMLAVKVLQKQGIKVVGLSFQSCFFNCEQAKKTAKNLGIELIIKDFSKLHLKMVKSPKYGYGKTMNPCIDCHSLMFKKAKAIMKKQRFDFIATGEVLGQRPMSQNKKALEIVEKEAGLLGYLVRPLSAKLLKKTILEQKGIIVREKLLDISGRSRKRQIALAKKWGMKYPSPAGGCILTDLEFSLKLKDLFKIAISCEKNDIELLRIGRHFWQDKNKIIIGRNEQENLKIKALANKRDILIELQDYSGPLTLVRSYEDKEQTEKALLKAKKLTQYYALKARNKKQVKFNIIQKQKQYIIAIDGGGTKTQAILADENGKYLNQIKTGPSNPNKIGIQKAVDTLSELIKKLMKNYSFSQIGFIYIALAGGLERDKNKARIIKKGLLKEIPGLSFLKNKIEIQGDQIAAFRSGTNEKTGIIIIAGTGSIVMGWKKGQEVVVGGWDYILGDQGSGFWLGQKALQMVCRDLDKRSSKTQLTDMILKKLRVKKQSDLMKKIYQKDIVKTIAQLSLLVDEAAEKKDKIAKEILNSAGQELALSFKTAVKELNLSKLKFPVVIIGGVFRSKIIFNIFKKEIKKIAPYAEVIRPKSAPILGAVKLALERFKH